MGGSPLQGAALFLSIAFYRAASLYGGAALFLFMQLKPKIQKTKEFRTGTNYQAAKGSQVDFENAIIHDVAVTQAVPALGHGMMVDEIALIMLEDLGNEKPIKVRFGHPNMSNTALGTQLGTAVNFRIDDDGHTLRADYHFQETARQSPVFSHDPVDYIMKKAVESPEGFGNSIVFSHDLVWVLKDGEEVDYWSGEVDQEELLHDLPVVRPTELFASDIVDEPAATRDGLFSVNWSLSADSVAADFTELIDNGILQFAEITNKSVEEATEHALRFAVRYFGNKGMLNMDEIEEKTDEIEEEVVEEETLEEEAAPLEVVTSDALEAILVDFGQKVVSSTEEVVNKALSKYEASVQDKIDTLADLVDKKLSQRRKYTSAEPRAIKESLANAIARLNTGEPGGEGLHGNSPLAKDKPTTAQQTNGRRYPA